MSKRKESISSVGSTPLKKGRRQQSDMSRASSRGAKKDCWRLLIEKNPPRFPFQSYYFEMQILLVDGHGNLHKSANELPLELRLITDDKKEVNDAFQIFGRQHPVIRRDGQVMVKVKIDCLSSDKGNRKFMFEVRPKADVQLKKPVLPTTSSWMKVVKYRLTLPLELPRTWYKDQGGRENCIELKVVLEAPEGKACSEEIPLNVSLLYDDESKVRDPKSRILQIGADSSLLIQASKRETLLKVRIEDVSKNHQSKGFRFLVEPKKTTHSSFIARVLSDPVTVKSKVNKKKPKRAIAANGGTKKLGQNEPDLAKQPSLSADARAPASAIPGGIDATLESQLNAKPAVQTARWCDNVKDTLFELQKLAVQRQVLENRLWQLLNDYDTVRPHLQAQLGLTSSAQQMRNVSLPSGLGSRESSLLGMELPSMSRESSFLNSNSMAMYLNSLSRQQQNQVEAVAAGLLPNRAASNIQHKPSYHRTTPKGSNDDFLIAAGEVDTSAMTRQHSLLPQAQISKRAPVVENLLSEFEGQEKSSQSQ